MLDRAGVVYKYTCPVRNCKPDNIFYIGMTQATLKQRLDQHYYNGYIKDDTIQNHKMKITKEQLIENTEILTYENNRYRLAIKESLLILSKNRVINKQFDNFTNLLKLHRYRNPTSNEYL